ncbi:hypothetical protein [Soonwooa sp.]|uniref:hypothetical protein n=1 Tax=Soonwooa sp. TaxID=1938592 RepID=UPI00261C1A1D|nr:hypothetical protein [Soonwooa sp.]
MKKLLLVPIMAISFMGNSQFKLTPENFVTEYDNTKNFIVLEFPDQTQKQLFDKTKMYIHSNFKNLKGDGYNEVEYGQIKLRESAIAKVNKILGLATITYMINTYEINFKDAKIMIKPTFEDAYVDDNYDSNIFLTGGSVVLGKSIFKKDGKVWMEDLYNGITEKTNEFVNGLKSSIDKKDDW